MFSTPLPRSKRTRTTSAIAAALPEPGTMPTMNGRTMLTAAVSLVLMVSAASSLAPKLSHAESVPAPLSAPAGPTSFADVVDSARARAPASSSTPTATSSPTTTSSRTPTGSRSRSTTASSTRRASSAATPRPTWPCSRWTTHRRCRTWIWQQRRGAHRRLGAGGRQPLRPRRLGQRRHHLGARARHQLRPLRRLSADRRAHQPRQLRRPAVRRPRP
jgi:hypothetical protein